MVDDITYLCKYLPTFFPEACKLALEKGYSKQENFDYAVKATGLSEEEVLRTKCGLMSDTLSYLLNFREDPKPGDVRAWRFRLVTVVNGQKQPDITHTFVILETSKRGEEENLYSPTFIDEGRERALLLIDSYIGCREFTCRYIADVNRFFMDLIFLQQSFNAEIWNAITGCQEVLDIPGSVEMTVREYSYDGSREGIMERFLLLQE